MNNKKMKVSIRQDITDKASKAELNLTGRGWSNVELSVKQFVDHIKLGYPFTHQFFGGKKTKDRFQQTDIIVADIDKNMTVDQALEHEFVKDYGAFIYTTPRHTEDHHRFRIVFILDRTIFDPNVYEAMYGGLMNEIPSTDPNVKSAAQFFQGNSNAQVWMLNKTLPEVVINKLVAYGVQTDIKSHSLQINETLTPTTLVHVKNKGLNELQFLPENTTIMCPFGTHQDKNPSAFVLVSKQGIRGVQCRSCLHKQWSKPIPIDNQFGFFDRLVKELAGKENSHFPYQGLTQFDHTLETSMGKSNFHVMNSKHVQMGELLPGIHLIKSPKGTGKTVLMSDIVNRIKDPKTRKKLGLSKDDQGKTILIGHRQTLIRESAHKLGLECYLDTGGYDTKVDVLHKWINGSPQVVARRTRKPQHYAVCLDSLSSRVRLAYEKYDVVIIDEAEQVFSHFLSEHMSHPTANFDILSKLLKKAKMVFLLDADLDRITLTGVLSCLSTPEDNANVPHRDDRKYDFQKLYCHLNEFTSKKRKIEIYTSKNHLQNDLIADIHAGKRCFVTSNSKKFVEGLYDSCTAAFKEKKFELVVSDRGDDETTRYFLKNITTEILNKNALFSSPSIGTGIDITFPKNSTEVDVVYGFFETKVNTHFDIDQQLGRVRHPGQVRVWINPARHRKTTSIEKIRTEILFDRKVEGLQYYLDHEGIHAGAGRHPFVDILATIISMRNQSMNRLRDNFIAHKKMTGWAVVPVEHNDLLAQKGQVIGKASRITRAKTLRSRLLSTPDLTDVERMKLDSKKDKNLPLTADEKFALNKYWIKHFYRQDVTEELLEFDDEGSTREKILLFEKLTNPIIKPIKYQEIISEKGWIIGSDIKPEQLRKPVFLREILCAAGFFDTKTMTLEANASYTTETLAQFVKFLKLQKNRDRYSFVFDKEINDHLEERPVSQLGSILRMIGLDHKVIKKNRGGGASVYQIDLIRYQEILRIVQKRASEKLTKKSSIRVI